MRSADDLYQDLEADRLQRESEIRLIVNILEKTGTESEQNILLRSLVLLTYAHLEGFCKFSLLAYTGAINAMGLLCKEVSVPLLTASLRDVFAALRNFDSKSPEFKKELADDKDLHMFWRERTFVEKFEEMLQRTVEIPDKLVDTKSNLNTQILKRNLYQLGLNHPDVDKHRAAIDKLLGVRNAIAHGDALRVPKSEEVQQYIAAAFEIMQYVQTSVFSAVKHGTFRRMQAA